MTHASVTISKSKPAPGSPGEVPHWSPASKDGVGTVLGGSPVWFTVGRGAVEEVFYPSPDRPVIAGLSLTVADGEHFVSDERTGAAHEVERPDDAIPLYRLTNKCRTGRYEIQKTIYTDPEHDVLIQETAFRSQPRPGTRLAVYIQLDTRLSDRPGDHTAWSRRSFWSTDASGWWRRPVFGLGLFGTWSAATVGLRAGRSDGRFDLARSGRLTEFYAVREQGTVSLTGAIDPDGCDSRFVLALGFGEDPDLAAREANSALSGDRRLIRALYWPTGCRAREH